MIGAAANNGDELAFEPDFARSLLATSIDGISTHHCTIVESMPKLRKTDRNSAATNTFSRVFMLAILVVVGASSQLPVSHFAFARFWPPSIMRCACCLPFSVAGKRPATFQSRWIFC